MWVYFRLLGKLLTLQSVGFNKSKLFRFKILDAVYIICRLTRGRLFSFNGKLFWTIFQAQSTLRMICTYICNNSVIAINSSWYAHKVALNNRMLSSVNISLWCLCLFAWLFAFAFAFFAQNYFLLIQYMLFFFFCFLCCLIYSYCFCCQYYWRWVVIVAAVTFEHINASERFPRHEAITTNQLAIVHQPLVTVTAKQLLYLQQQSSATT